MEPIQPPGGLLLEHVERMGSASSARSYHDLPGAAGLSGNRKAQGGQDHLRPNSTMYSMIAHFPIKPSPGSQWPFSRAKPMLTQADDVIDGLPLFALSVVALRCGIWSAIGISVIE
jgi:hypothetical protein